MVTHDMQQDLDLVMKAAAIIKRDVEAFMADTDATLDALAGRLAALEAWRNRLERAGTPRGQPPARRRLHPVPRAARGEGEDV